MGRTLLDTPRHKAASINAYPYGLVGNGLSCALVSKQGSVDWMCLPYFDSPSCFASSLDKDRGGSLGITFPYGADYTSTQTYLKNTNVLVTTFTNHTSRFQLIDFMPRWEEGPRGKAHCPPQFTRILRVLSGEVKLNIVFDPKLDYGRGETTVHSVDEHTLVARNGEHRLFLTTNLKATRVLHEDFITLKPGKDYFVAVSNEAWQQPPVLGQIHDGLEKTLFYWRRWAKNCYVPEDYQPEVLRSALTLKMLTFEPTGAVVAAPTASWPEEMGGTRNWDYRFCWVRDSYFIVDALLKLSKFEETEAFIGYLKNVIKDNMAYIAPLFTIHGDPCPPVTELDHLSGMRNSQPVRIGNGATYHHQTDVYGEAILAMFPLFNDERVVRMDCDELWRLVRSLVHFAINTFPEKDNGIWEIEDPPRHYTFSKLLCWAAVDRGCSIAKSLKQEADFRKWSAIRRSMKDDILTNAWSEEAQAFTQYYGGTSLDASTLLMVTLGFIDPKDPRMISTVERTEQELKKGGFVFRYTNVDDHGAPENAFILCSFWLIDAMILSGKKKKARQYFEEILSYANHVGLFAEHLSPETFEMTGNFPQGYTHVAIINTAMLLEQR